jgi:SPOR domain
MTVFSTGRILSPHSLSVLALVFTVACQPGQNPFTRGNDDPPADTSVATANSVQLIDRDVEAPDVFQVADNALWDGRPSLGGVWVASPDAVDPERVIMRNPANGKFVIGALFKRERDNPGPKLQISSDAAAALGLLAGQPGKISVTALRREEAPAKVDAGRPILDAAETVQTETLATSVNAPASKPLMPLAPSSVAAAAPAQPAPAVAAPTAITAATGAYIQIGIFSIEANAQRAVATLTAAGVAAQMRTETAKGKTYWSVGARGDAAVLAKVKAAGFKDAYLAKG